MSDFDQLILNNHRNNSKLKKLCDPLFRNFGFNSLFYHYISSEGFGTSFGTHNQSFENYFLEHQYKINPYLRHPKYFQNGIQFIQEIRDQDYQNTISFKQFDINYQFVIFERTENGCEGFSFSFDPSQKQSLSNIMNYVPILNCFIKNFKKEGSNIIKNAFDNQLFIPKYLGECFLKENIYLPNFIEYQKKINFLQGMGIIGPKDDIKLSSREIECIRHLLQGYTATETANLLNLSKRTVEHYLENIKLKSNCYSKLELFNKFNQIDALGLL